MADISISSAFMMNCGQGEVAAAHMADSSRAFMMNGGEGEHSYAKNSAYQGSSLDVVRPIIEDEIQAKLDIDELCLTRPNCFVIADFGCSTGHNSFRAIEVVTKAVKEKFEKEGPHCIPEFQVFLNDQVLNDFNTLFNSLPVQRNYYVAGVAGPFHTRLFPKASLHIAYSSWSLHWLSEVPKALTDRTCSAFNRGRIHYQGAPVEVFDAYSEQFDKDIMSFLDSRAQELVGGGLLTLLIPAVPDFWDPEKDYVIPTGISIIGSCYQDLVKEGKLSPHVVDMVNVPLYMPTPNQLKVILEKQRDFDVERMEAFSHPAVHENPRATALFYRSVSEGLVRKHMEMHHIDELFRRVELKIEKSRLFRDGNDKTMVSFIILRRKKLI